MHEQLLDLFALIKDRVLTSLTTLPDRQDWLWGVAIVIGFSAIAMLIGFSTRFLTLEAADTSLSKRLQLGFGLFFIPVTTEEIIFRATFLPHATEHVTISQLWFWGTIGVFAFLIYHILLAATIYRVAWSTFTNPIFLCLAACLGISCSIAYLISGSLWLGVVIHWLADLIWLFGLGGYKKVMQPIAFIHNR